MLWVLFPTFFLTEGERRWDGLGRGALDESQCVKSLHVHQKRRQSGMCTLGAKIVLASANSQSRAHTRSLKKSSELLTRNMVGKRPLRVSAVHGDLACMSVIRIGLSAFCATGGRGGLLSW